MDASNSNKLPPREITDLQGGKKDILFSVTIIVVPMVILTALLLGLIIQNQVPQTYSALPGVPDPLATESSAFLVDFSATRLLTVASWTSTVASLLPSFVMVLVSYPVARAILNASKKKNTDDLPTPYQLSMLFGVLSGSIGSLWNWFKYRGWKKRERVNGVAKGSITWLVFVSVLGLVEYQKHLLRTAKMRTHSRYLIVIADTWLHAATSIIQLLQALPGSSSVSTFGRGFYSSECINDAYYPCSISTGNHDTGLINGSEGFRTLANTSTQNLLLSFLYKGQSYALITDANVPQDTVYQAQTFAVTTQCTLITEECGLSLGTAGSTPFNCSGEFSGYLPNYKYYIPYTLNPSWGLAGVEFYQDSRLTRNFSTAVTEIVGGPFTPANPVYIGAYGLVLGFSDGSSALLNSSEFFSTETQGLGFILGCNMTVYDLEYIWYNGNVSVKQMTISNTGVVRVLTAAFVKELANLANLAQSAAGEDTPSAFVESWTTGFSAMVLGISAGIMSPRANIMEQARISTLIARVPKAPLVILVFLTLLYAAVGIVLAFMAAQAGAGETKNVHGRLSVAGLAAKCFESEDRYEGPAKEIHDLFAENEIGARDHRCSKVSIVASDRGGWKYDLIEKDEEANSVGLTSKDSKSLEPYSRLV
jgi:hypothetical protein